MNKIVGDEFVPSDKLVELFLVSSRFSPLCIKYFNSAFYSYTLMFYPDKLKILTGDVRKYISRKVGDYLATIGFRAVAKGLNRVYVSDGRQFIGTGKNGALFMSDTVKDGFIERYALVRNQDRILLELHAELKDFVNRGGCIGGEWGWGVLKLDNAGLYLDFAKKQ